LFWLTDKTNAAYLLLTPQQAEKNPHFMEVLKGVFQHKLNNDFVTKSKAEERQKVFKEFSKAQSSYESVKLVYDTIWDIIADNNLDAKVYFTLNCWYLFKLIKTIFCWVLEC
jgi:hypothetical protein